MTTIINAKLCHGTEREPMLSLAGKEFVHMLFERLKKSSRGIYKDPLMKVLGLERHSAEELNLNVNNNLLKNKGNKNVKNICKQ